MSSGATDLAVYAKSSSSSSTAYVTYTLPFKVKKVKWHHKAKMKMMGQTDLKMGE